MSEKFMNFSVGPVEMDEVILKMGSDQLPYFRTDEFSNMNLENEKLIKNIISAEDNSRAIFLTASGTGAMEASIINVFNEEDRVLIINGGSFGARFTEIFNIYDLKYEEIKLNYHEVLTYKHLEKYKDKGFTGFVVNIHETSTGVLYDMELISEFCKSQNLTLVVDAISSVLSDSYNMKDSNVDVTILSSQKALALPPGLSMIVLSEKAVNKVKCNKVKSLYFDLKGYLSNGERGQTPFTPAVGIMLQLNERLKRIYEVGVDIYIEKTNSIAEDFRERIVTLPFKIKSESMSNTVTPLEPIGKMTAHEIFEYLKDKHNIFLCPNGGDLKDTLIRVGHIGNLSIEHNDRLIEALNEMKECELI